MICNHQFDLPSRIYIQLNSASIPGSPFTCMIRACRNYQTIGEPSLVFGAEGAADGEFCRPWGVCCTKVRSIFIILCKG